MGGAGGGNTVHMATDDETLARIREVLDRSPRIDNSRIEVARDGEQIVLRGTVATAEEAGVAAVIADGAIEVANGPPVRSQLRVDANLRETVVDAATGGARGPQPFDEDHKPADLTTDSAAALGENAAWDPPDAPSAAVPHDRPTDRARGE